VTGSSPSPSSPGVTALAGKLDNEFIRVVNGGHQIDLPRGERPASTLTWRVPARPNALERNRARAYHVGYCGMANAIKFTPPGRAGRCARRARRRTDGDRGGGREA
jgi:hypothetical protein